MRMLIVLLIRGCNKTMFWLMTLTWILYLLLQLARYSMKHALTSAGTFYFFSAVALLSGIFVYAFVPETKGRALEEIEQSLDGLPLQSCFNRFVPMWKLGDLFCFQTLNFVLLFNKLQFYSTTRKKKRYKAFPSSDHIETEEDQSPNRANLLTSGRNKHWRLNY